MSNQSDFGGTESSDSGTHDEQALTLGNVGATLKTQKGNTPIYLSGVMWLTIVALVAMIFPDAKEWLEANPVEATSVLGAVNVILRFVTSGKKKLSGVEKEFAEPTGDQDGGADESAPRASHTSGAGGSALMLMIGMSLIMMTWACSTDNQTSTSVALDDGRVVVIRGGSSLVVDRDNHSVAWSQSTPDVVVVPPVVQATSK